MLTPLRFNYFVGVQGDGFRQFVRVNTYYVAKATNILVPDPERFAWLSYTGSRQSRSYLAQLLLAKVAQAKFVDNQRRPPEDRRLPRLIEPFVGPGQVFLNSSHWTRNMPLFQSVVGGDLNPYLIGVYRGLQEIGDPFWQSYLTHAERWDANIEHNYAQFMDELNQGGQAALRNHAAHPEAAQMALYTYIWLVNRSGQGTRLNARGGLYGYLYYRSPDRAERIRNRESTTLQNVRQLLQLIDLNVEVRDFRQTSGLAEPQDIVFMDPPFSRFSTVVPRPDQAYLERFGTTTRDHYGIPDETGHEFQTRVVDEARRLVQQGTTVILHNNANPGLVQAYAQLIWPPNLSPAQRRHYTYTYRSPLSQSEAYQLTILPGQGNTAVAASPDEIFNAWLSAGGDNYRIDEFFEQRWHPDAADQRYQQRYTQQEMDRRYHDVEYHPHGKPNLIPNIAHLEVSDSDSDSDEIDQIDEAPALPRDVSRRRRRPSGQGQGPALPQVVSWRPPRSGEPGPRTLKGFLQSMKDRGELPKEIPLDGGFRMLPQWLRTPVESWARGLFWDPSPEGHLYTLPDVVALTGGLVSYGKMNDWRQEAVAAIPGPPTEVLEWRPPEPGVRGPRTLREFLQSMADRRQLPAGVLLATYRALGSLGPGTMAWVQAWALGLFSDPRTYGNDDVVDLSGDLVDTGSVWRWRKRHAEGTRAP